MNNRLKGPNTGRKRKIAAGAVLALSLTLPLNAFAGGDEDALSRINLLEHQASGLSSQIMQMSSFAGAIVPPADIASQPERILVAQSSRDVASLNVKIGQLEEQIRVLTGQMEGLQFQMTQLQTLIERMQEDSDARLSALEGGSSLGKTDAVPLSGGVTPLGEAPQTQILNAPEDNDFGSVTTDLGDGVDLTFDPDSEPFELGAPESVLGTLTLDDLSAGLGTPDFTINDGSFVTDRDADAQYRAGYDAVIRGDYAFAEDQFRQFIGLFPEHRLAADATAWLGEALLQRSDYEEAADILLTGWQTYPSSPRAPEMLLKLAIALNGAGENDTACRTFSDVFRRYENMTPAFQARLAEEMGKAGC